MGWDVTYHPFGATEVAALYFDLVRDPDLVPDVCRRFELSEFYAGRLVEVLKSAKAIGPEVPFSKGHAFHLAVVSGFLRRYWYVRGAAFSFLVEANQAFCGYTTPWEQLAPEAFRTARFDNRITENYCGGVFLGPEGLEKLRSDYRTVPSVRTALEQLFSHKRLEVFWKAVDSALNQSLGLVEATEVIEPNPFDLNKSTCLSNLFHCDPAGALLYRDAAIEQVADT